VQIALATGGGRPAAKGSPIEVGDTIVSAKASMAQLKMGDGAIIVVQPESRLTVVEFSYAGKEDGTEKARFRLDQGGFRSITGAIGHTNKGNYTIETPIAHIGVRGTDHESWYFPSHDSTDGVTTEAGLYNRVTVGQTYIQNGTGEVVIGPNQVGYASTAVDQPHLLGATPEFFNRSIQPRSVRVGPQPGTTMTAQGGPQQGTSGTISGSSGTVAGFTAPRGKEGMSFGETAVNPVISPSGATLANAGSDPALGVNWGTWQGGITRVNGRPTTGAVNFISSTNLTTAAQLAALPPQVVTANYTTLVPGSGIVTGGPINQPPVTGTVNSLSVGVNLTSQTITNYSVNASVGTTNWTGSGSGSFTQYMGSGIAIDGKCAGCVAGVGSPTAHGTATGAFVGGQVEGMTTAFGMKAANQSMSGVGLLTR
jgi:hypothetical protein